jgi:hypothetical protein
VRRFFCFCFVGGESRTLAATCWGEGEGSCARRRGCARARPRRVRASPQCMRSTACSRRAASRFRRAALPLALARSLRRRPTHRLPLLSSLAPQTPAGRSGGTLPPRGSPRRSAARGRTSTATAASRRARCVRGRAGRASSCVSLSARAAMRSPLRCLALARPPLLPTQDARFYAGVVPLSEPFECVCGGAVGCGSATCPPPPVFTPPVFTPPAPRAPAPRRAATRART